VNIPKNASRANLKRNILTTMGYFLVAYMVVNILATALVFTLMWVLKLPSSAHLGISRVNDPSYQMSLPYILIINLLCWTGFAALSYRKRMGGSVSLLEALRIGLLWLVSAMVIDLVFFVLVPTPISLSAHEFYSDQQPWITLSYVSILAGHLIASVLSRFRTQKLGS
jgi:hypothetical protein